MANGWTRGWYKYLAISVQWGLLYWTIFVLKMHIGLAKTVRSVSWADGSPCPNLPLHLFLSQLLLQNKPFTLLSQPMFTSQRTQPVTIIYLSLNNYHVIAILLIFKLLELELLWYLSLCLSWHNYQDINKMHAWTLNSRLRSMGSGRCVL